MTHDEANQLAIRYKNIWRGGPATEELREHFAEMDAIRAQRAVTNCAQRLDHPPSIAQLWREYETTRSPLEYGWKAPADTGDAISLDDHLARLEQRAGHDLAAADELERWAHLRRTGVTTALRLDLGAET
jgi:hypothetical protein